MYVCMYLHIFEFTYCTYGYLIAVDFSSFHGSELLFLKLTTCKLFEIACTMKKMPYDICHLQVSEKDSQVIA